MENFTVKRIIFRIAQICKNRHMYRLWDYTADTRIKTHKRQEYKKHLFTKSIYEMTGDWSGRTFQL